VMLRLLFNSTAFYCYEFFDFYYYYSIIISMLFSHSVGCGVREQHRAYRCEPEADSDP
jgi:hypothetical protein